jgi:hypothetical protein
MLPSDEQLKIHYLIEKLNDYQLAKIYSVGRNTLRNWRNKNNISSKTNKKGLTADLCPGIINQLEEGKTLTHVAETLGVISCNRNN